MKLEPFTIYQLGLSVACVLVCAGLAISAIIRAYKYPPAPKLPDREEQ